VKSPLNNRYLNNEGQECKAGDVRGRALVERGEMERVKEGDVFSIHV
jgi:hypothetical protein